MNDITCFIENLKKNYNRNKNRLLKWKYIQSKYTK